VCAVIGGLTRFGGLRWLVSLLHHECGSIVEYPKDVLDSNDVVIYIKYGKNTEKMHKVEST
jgi:hypothetical protein